MAHESATITLSSDEALVLYDFVSRYSENDTLTLEHPGEQSALWRLCAALEKVLVEPFDSNYAELLKGARARLAEECGPK